MKILKLIPILFLAGILFSCTQSEASENGFTSNEQDDQLVEWVNMSEAQSAAKEDGKWVLIDVYTEWCGFCRRMNSETYRDERVLEIIEENYHPVRIDAESETSIVFNNEEVTMKEFAYAFRVSSYPTTIIITPEGEPFAAQPGFMDARMFTDILNFVATHSYEKMSFEDYQKQSGR